MIVGHPEHLELAPVVATRGRTIVVEGLLVDTGGQPAESGVRVEVLGSLGPYPRSGSTEVSDASGRFSLQLLRGIRYRFTVPGPGDTLVTVDHVPDGTPVGLVVPET